MSRSTLIVALTAAMLTAAFPARAQDAPAATGCEGVTRPKAEGREGVTRPPADSHEGEGHDHEHEKGPQSAAPS